MTVPDGAPTVKLASAADFRLGDLWVRPSTCEVVGPSGRIILQPRVMQVLVVLAGASDRIVSREELITRCWSGRAVSEGALNRVIVQLRKLSEAEGGGAFRLETVPRVGYGLTTFNTGPAPSITAEADRPAAGVPVPARARMKRRHVLIGGGAAGAMGLGGAALWLGGRSKRTRIAVLPFAAEGADLRAPAAAIRDDLVTSLLAVRDLEVVARTSSRALRTDPAVQAERDLGATHVLDGSLQRRGGSVRINVSLTDVRRRSVVWSDHYDAEDGDLFALQARVAKDVQGVLRMALIQGRIVQPRIDPAAYRLYAEGGLLLDEGDPVAAVAKLKAAVERGPNFSRAWSQLAAAYIAQQGSVDQAAYTPIPRGLARDAAQRALDLDDRNADAWSTLAEASSRAGAWAYIEKLHRNTMACEPSNIQTLYAAAQFYADVGWNDRAIGLLRRASALDPVSPYPTFLLLRVLDTGGHEAEIDAQMSRALPRWRGNRSLWRFATGAQSGNNDTMWPSG